MSFYHVEQPHGSRLCLAAVCAMIAGETLGHVQEFCQHFDATEPLRFREAVRYLNAHGWHLGGYVPGPHPVWTCLLSTLLRRRIGPAVVMVDNGAGGNHAVLWTGRGVFDPARRHVMRLKDYTVREWWPVLQVVESAGDVQK